jgi:DNA-binding transcriptional MerR regulator
MLELADRFVTSIQRIADALEKLIEAREKTALQLGPILSGGKELLELAIGEARSQVSDAAEPDSEKAIGQESPTGTNIAEGPHGPGGPDTGPKRKCPTKEEMQALRDKAVEAVKAAGFTLSEVAASLKATSDKWSTRQCEKVLEMAAEAIRIVGDKGQEITKAASPEPHASATSAQETPQAQTTPATPEEEAKPARDYTNDALFTFIRAQANGKSLTIATAEELIKDITENKPPKLETVRAYLAACVNNGVLTHPRAMELIRLRGQLPGMAPEVVEKLTLPQVAPVLYIAIVCDIAREAGVQ